MTSRRLGGMATKRRARPQIVAPAGSDTATLPISVVIPARNSAATVARAVRSALGQRPFRPAEVIVVDDASLDRTGAIARAAGARVITCPVQQGVSDARNTGIRAAEASWIATLDADDIWLPSHLATLWRCRETAVLVATSALACGDLEADDRIWGVSRPVRIDSPMRLFIPFNPIMPSAALFERQTAIDAGLFASGMTRSEDLDLWVRIIERGPGLALPHVTVLYAVHDEQASADRDAMRVATRAVLSTYRNRRWWSSRFDRRLAGVAEWDTLRAMLRQRNRLGAAQACVRVASSPDRLNGILRLLWLRAELRRRLRMRTAHDVAAARVARRAYM